MKLLNRLVRLFAPLQDGDGDGDGDGDVDGDGDKGGTGDGSAGGEGKPAWCPDKFYDIEQNVVRSEVMAKSFTELEGKMREGKKALAAEILEDRKKEIPETYEIKLPEFEAGTVPEGIEITLKPEDPIAEWFMGFAKEMGLSQDQFSEAVETYIKLEVAALPDIGKEIKKLGDYGNDRVQRVNTWLEKSLENKHMLAIKPFLQSAESIEALEVLMKGHKPSDFDGDTGSALTLEELQTMQKDPKAWQQQDKAFLRKISEGYQRLYNR